MSPEPGHTDLADTIVRLLDARAPDATICPSEVARAVWPEDWRRHMADVRAAALRLIEDGTICAMQRGRVVELNRTKGPYRLARVRLSFA